MDTLCGVDGMIDWRQMQSLVRLMPDLHKTLLLAMLLPDGKTVQEMVFTSEHAQFRQKHLKRVQQQTSQVPGQQKKKKKQKQQEQEQQSTKPMEGDEKDPSKADSDIVEK